MVSVGDIVVVTIPTYWSVGQQGAAALQARLRQAGLSVVAFDDSGLPWGRLLGRGELIISVSPGVTAFGAPQDVGGLVAGAAYAAGYDIDAGFRTEHLRRNSSGNQSPADLYRSVQTQPNVGLNNNGPELSSFPSGMVLAIGALVFAAFVLKR